MWWVLWHLAEECPGLSLLACYVCAGQGLGEGLDFWGGDPEPGTPESGSWRNGWPFENFDSRRRGALEIGKIPIEAPVRITTDAPGARVGAFQ